MGKLYLNTQMILDKSFNVDFKGYSASEVDEFLDVVLEDYQTFESKINELNNLIDSLKVENASLRAINIELEGRQKATDDINVCNSVDLLKRVSRLEQEVFKK